MICLTGDVHNMSMGTNEQKYLNGITEVEVTKKYVDILEKYGVKATLYVTGKCFAEELSSLKSWATSSMVEIGGHTYDGFPLSFIEKVPYWLRKRTPPSHRPTYGTYNQQKKDIQKTLNIIKKHMGERPISWRSHGFIHDDNTYKILANEGVKYISDDIKKSILLPYKTTGELICHPLNVINDHDHLYHAHRDHEFVQKAKAVGYGTDEFGSDSYEIQELCNLMIKQASEIDNAGGIATILMHPICMWVADKFQSFEHMVKFLSQRNNIFAKEIQEEECK